MIENIHKYIPRSDNVHLLVDKRNISIRYIYGINISIGTTNPDFIVIKYKTWVDDIDGSFIYNFGYSSAVFYFDSFYNCCWVRECEPCAYGGFYTVTLHLEVKEEGPTRIINNSSRVLDRISLIDLD